MPLRRQVIITFAILIVLSTSYALFSVNVANQNKQTIADTATALAQEKILNEFKMQTVYTNLGYMDAIIDKESGEIDADIMQQHNQYRNWITSNNEQFAHVFGSDWQSLRKEITNWNRAGDDLFSAVRNHAEEKMYAEFDDRLDGALDLIVASAEKRLKIVSKTANEKLSVLQSTADHSVNVGMVSAVGLFALMLIGSFYLLRVIESINKNLVLSLSTIADRMTNSTDENKRIATELSANVERESAALQEMSASINEITAMAKRNSESSRRTITLSRNVKSHTDGAHKDVHDVRQAIERVKDVNNRLSSEIQTSSEQFSSIITIVSNIGDKAKIINDIVFQTKLLSFNASVEAARAGEHGQGFAVVAEEIGNLALSSGKAAVEITQMLEQSIEQVQKITTTMNTRINPIKQENESIIEKTMALSSGCRTSLENVLKSANDSDTAIHEIAEATDEQGRGLDEMAKATTELDAISNAVQSSSADVDKVGMIITTNLESLEGQINSIQTTIWGHRKVA